MLLRVDIPVIMDKTKVAKKTLIAEVYRLEAFTRRALERKNKVLNKLEKYKEDQENILENKNEEIKILKDKIVFFNKLFKSCLAHKKEIKELKETLKEKVFKMDMKDHIVRDMQDKVNHENIVNDALAADNEFLKAENAKLLETWNLE